MNRRQLLKLLTSGVVGLASDAIDIDRLLWVPGKKKIFLPTDEAWLYRPTDADILAQEIARITPYLKGVFDMDRYFYSRIAAGGIEKVTPREIRVPLEYKESNNRTVRVPLLIKPGDVDWSTEE